jgi:hypothetical protein
MQKRITWKLEKRKLIDLKPHPKNPRQFTEKGMKDLENSINSIGFMQPININQDGTILSGHARAMKLKEMGDNEVDVYVPDRLLTPKQEEEVLVRANANTAGQWDFDILANQFEDFELTDWGMDIPQVENMPDLSILEDSSNDDKLTELADGVKKGIMIEFEPDHYQEAYDLVKYWREKQLYIGKFLVDKLKAEKNKL